MQASETHFRIHKALRMNLSLETDHLIVLFCPPVPAVFRQVRVLEHQKR